MGSAGTSVTVRPSIQTDARFAVSVEPRHAGLEAAKAAAARAQAAAERDAAGEAEEKFASHVSNSNPKSS